MDKLFEKQYSIELPKLRSGVNHAEFLIDRSFFNEFEYSMVKEGEVKADVTIQKSESYLDVTFEFIGHIILNCDRCDEPYPHEIHAVYRVIFSYDSRLEFETDEVVMIDRNDTMLNLSGEFYDFIHLEIPLRRVPAPEIHKCPPKVLDILGIREDEGVVVSVEKPEGEQNASPQETESDTDAEIDPRWLALKKLKENNKK